VGFLVLPVVGLAQRAPWSHLWTDLTDPATKEALRLSLECSLAATALSALFGIPVAWVLARSDFPGRRLTRAVVLLPMVLPPVVGGIALFFALGPRGLLGQYLDRWFDVRLPFTTLGAIIAETFVAMPFLIITLEAAMRGLDRRYEAAAATLGAGRWTVFRRVTLPMIAPSLLAGAALSWARALGEFGATVTFAGSLQGKTETVPLAIFGRFEGNDLGGAIALSLVLVVVSTAVLVALRDRWLVA
jgi:molybdate transport system permease protein